MHAAMTFDQIGAELGITAGEAYRIYQRAMYKLRRIKDRQLLATAHIEAGLLAQARQTRQKETPHNAPSGFHIGA
jgi:hypothetical protein